METGNRRLKEEPLRSCPWRIVNFWRFLHFAISSPCSAMRDLAALFIPCGQKSQSTLKRLHFQSHNFLARLFF
jgi:hypothetical protein